MAKTEKGHGNGIGFVDWPHGGVDCLLLSVIVKFYFWFWLINDVCRVQRLLLKGVHYPICAMSQRWTWPDWLDGFTGRPKRPLRCPLVRIKKEITACIKKEITARIKKGF